MRMICASFLALVILTGAGAAQQGHNSAEMNHDDHARQADAQVGAATQGGQAAFAAIQEIVALLMADPDTNWAGVDIEALRQHLIDMDNVTLRAAIVAVPIDAGARFEATSDEPGAVQSIRNMVPAHVAAMKGDDRWQMQAETIPGGASLTVTGADPERIRALGFIGIMSVGMHHQDHHLSLAQGVNPHAH